MCSNEETQQMSVGLNDDSNGSNEDAQCKCLKWQAHPVSVEVADATDLHFQHFT